MGIERDQQDIGHADDQRHGHRQGKIALCNIGKQVRQHAARRRAQQNEAHRKRSRGHDGHRQPDTDQRGHDQHGNHPEYQCPSVPEDLRKVSLCQRQPHRGHDRDQRTGQKPIAQQGH